MKNHWQAIYLFDETKLFAAAAVPTASKLTLKVSKWIFHVYKVLTAEIGLRSYLEQNY